MAERIDCPAPQPKDLESPLLTRMLFPAPYEVPEKKAKKAATGTRDGLCRKGALDTTSEDTETNSTTEEEEEEIHPPPTRGRKRKVSTQGKAETSKKGKTSLPDYSAATSNSSEEWDPRVKPLAKS